MPQQRLIALAKIADAAVRAEAQSGVPAELTAAQCCLESGYLKHAPGNNAFGMKYVKARHTKFRELMTTEVEKGVPVRKTQMFAVYDSLEEGFLDHDRLISTGKPYAEAWARYRQDRNFVPFVRAIAKRYATDPAYADKLFNIIAKPEFSCALTAARANLTTQTTGENDAKSE